MVDGTLQNLTVKYSCLTTPPLLNSIVQPGDEREGPVDGVSVARRAKTVETKSSAPREFEDNEVGNWYSNWE